MCKFVDGVYFWVYINIFWLHHPCIRVSYLHSGVVHDMCIRAFLYPQRQKMTFSCSLRACKLDSRHIRHGRPILTNQGTSHIGCWYDHAPQFPPKNSTQIDYRYPGSWCFHPGTCRWRGRLSAFWINRDCCRHSLPLSKKWWCTYAF